MARLKHIPKVKKKLSTAKLQRKHCKVVNSDDSEDSFLPDDDSDDGGSVDGVVFDANDDDVGSDTDATDIDDLDCDDQLKLFAGNCHPPEYYQQGLEEFNESEWEAQDYSPTTTALLNDIEKQWQLYCQFIHSDPQKCYEEITLGRLHSFFDWLFNQKFGKKGRRKPGIKKKSTLDTYWKLFRLVFQRATGTKIEPKKLAEKNSLSRQKRPNRCMTTDQLKDKVETTLSTTRKTFKLGELRILAVLFLLLLSPSGSRPSAILSLKFGDIRVVLSRDPEGGPHNLLVQFTPEFTKTFLGDKDAKTFTVPETLFDPTLLLSPHIFLLGIIFRHQAFRAACLTSAECLEKLDIHPDELELPLYLRENLEDVYVFRQAVVTLTGYEISSDKVITYAMIAAWFKKIGEIMGLEASFILYSLRYNAANEFDQSSDISEALRNLTMGHANSGPHQKHYLGRIISADLWGILRGQKPQTALMKQSCSIGHSISKRRPTALTREQVASVDNHPIVKSLTRHLHKLPRNSEQRQEARKKLRNEKLRLRRQLLQQTRAEWTPKQATDDIERQLSGRGFAKPTEIDTSCQQKPAQKRLLAALTAPTADTLKGQYLRRTNAINQVSAYCLVQEGCPARRSQAPSTKTAVASPPTDPSEVDPLTAAIASVMVGGEKGKRPRRCFVCIGQALCSRADYNDDLIRPFYTSNDLTKHFRRRHLTKVKYGATPKCEICVEEFGHTEHFRRHAVEVHGTLSGK